MSGKPLILMVDDVPKNLQVLGTMLRNSGYSVSAATSGQQALTMLEKMEPRLILLDIMMPGMDGIQVCETLKENDRTRDIPVIFLTARTQTEDIVRGFEAGAVDYVTKPFQKAELLARVDTHLKLKAAQNEIIQLERKNTVMAMAVTANHEINQPLTILQGNFEMYRNSLEPSAVTQKQERSLTKVQSSIDRIQKILQKFMESESMHFGEYVGEKKRVVFD